MAEQKFARLCDSRVATIVECLRIALASLAVVVVPWSSLAQTGAADTIRSEYSRIGDASHFEFEGSGAERYKIRRDSASNGGVVLLVPSLSEASIQRLKEIGDSQAKVSKIDPNGPDGMVEVHFALGKGVDYFDYVSDQPTRLVIDFFSSDEKPRDAKALSQVDEPTAAPKEAAAAALPEKKSVEKPAAKSTEKAKTKEREPAGGDFVIVAKQGLSGTTTLTAEPTPLAEKIASRRDFERGIFDGGDPEFRRFTVKDYEIKESARLASRAALRISFPMLDLGFPKLAALIETPPIYEVTAKETEENKEARLLVTLFKNKRQGLLLETAKDFLKKYPNSEYDEIIRYLMADTHYDLWLKERQYKEENKILDETNLHDSDFEEAMGYYNNLVEKYPDSPMTTRTLLLVGYSYLERGDSFGALKTFQRFVRLKPDSKHAGQVKVSIARGFLALNRWEDALRELESVEKDAKNIKDRQEAAFRRGDVHFRRGDYQKALTAYTEAIDKHPDATGRFPNAFYNRAEARFRMNQEREAIDAYRQFLQKFPEHSHGGYAMTRIGELIETLVGAEDSRVTGAFFESYFRYRSTPGADIARMRVLTARMPKMKSRELRDSLREIDEITKRDRDLPSIQEFRTITVADAFTARQEYETALKDLVQFYKENTQSKHLDLIRGRIVRNLAEGINKAVSDGDFIQGLRLYSRDQSGWLKGVRRADLPYFAGRAYEQAGVYGEAATAYRETLGYLLERQTPTGETKADAKLDRDVFEKPLSIENVRLRLAAVAAQEKDFALAETQLKQIKDLKVLDHKDLIERAGIATDVSEARGQIPAARRYLDEMIKSFEAVPGSDAAATGLLHLRKAKLALKDKDLKAADEAITQVLKVSAGEDPTTERLRSSALETKAEVLLARGKKRDAIQSYKALLEIPIANADASRAGYDSVRYQLGKLLFEVGDLKAAEATWGQLTQDDKNLWRQLAKEQMTGAKWREEYKRYIDRIPAAAEIR